MSKAHIIMNLNCRAYITAGKIGEVLHSNKVIVMDWRFPCVLKIPGARIIAQVRWEVRRWLLECND